MRWESKMKPPNSAQIQNPIYLSNRPRLSQDLLLGAICKKGKDTKRKYCIQRRTIVLLILSRRSWDLMDSFEVVINERKWALSVLDRVIRCDLEKEAFFPKEGWTNFTPFASVPGLRLTITRNIAFLPLVSLRESQNCKRFSFTVGAAGQPILNTCFKFTQLDKKYSQTLVNIVLHLFLKKLQGK